MSAIPSQDTLRQMVSRWVPPHRVPGRFRIHCDTSDFFRVEYDDVVILNGKSYFIRHNAKEQRFGLDEEVKFWVKRAIDLENGALKILKLVFYERFMSRIGDIEFECFRSPKKEARILERVSDHKNFMHGFSTRDKKGNLIRILDFIRGETLSDHVGDMGMDHETYFHERFPGILDHFFECVQAIRFLHENGERHGDIRRDHILVEQETGDYRWIDFDFNYRHRENIYGYDLFGLGNVLVFLAGMGDVLLRDLRREGNPCLEALCDGDLNMVFNYRVVNLRKVYPYISESLNRILMHFSTGANWFYENTEQFLADLEKVKSDH
jgi:hypothetical protein